MSINLTSLDFCPVLNEKKLSHPLHAFLISNLPFAQIRLTLQLMRKSFLWAIQRSPVVTCNVKASDGFYRMRESG